MRAKHLLAVILTVLAASFTSQAELRYQYWFDSETTGIVSGKMQGDSITLAIPTDDIPSGMHFFNWRGVSANDEAGILFRTLLYVHHSDKKSIPAVHEAWFDSDYSSRVTSEESVFRVNLPDDISGIHRFNLLSRDAEGNPGILLRTLVYIAPENSVAVGGYEYWFDDDAESIVSSYCKTESLIFGIDVSHLGDGTHIFHFRPLNESLQPGETINEEFVLGSHSGLEATVGSDSQVTVYDINGNMLLHDANPDMLYTLPQGIYIVNGKKMLIR